MKSPPEKTLGYTIVTIICAIVLNIVAAAVMGAVAGPALWGAGMASARGDSGVVSVNGQSVDIARLAAASSDRRRLRQGHGPEPQWRQDRASRSIRRS